MKQISKQVSVWFPDVEVLKEIQALAKKQKRGLGSIICSTWKKTNEKERENVNNNS